MERPAEASNAVPAASKAIGITEGSRWPIVTSNRKNSTKVHPSRSRRLGQA